MQDSLKSDIDSRFSEYDKRFEQVDKIDNILTEAQQNQVAAQERARLAAESKNRNDYAPQSWEQLRRDSANDAYERMKREQEQETLRQQREAQLQTEEENQLAAELDKDIEALRRSGYLPETINPNDPSDPGKFAENELLARAAQLETPNLSAVAQELAFHHQKDEYFDRNTLSYKPASNITHALAGKMAPVGNSSVSAGGSSFNGPTSAELRNMSMAELSEMAKFRGSGPVPTSAESISGF